MPDCSYHSPIGDLKLTHESGRLCALDLMPQEDVSLLPAAPDWLAKPLSAYFSGENLNPDLPCAAPARQSAFQSRLWDLLRRIPPGQTLSYSAAARELDSSPRGVGAGCRSNPLPLVIPCHRIIAKNGQLCGYIGRNGLDLKRWLLDHEAKYSA